MLCPPRPRRPSGPPAATSDQQYAPPAPPPLAPRGFENGNFHYPGSRNAHGPWDERSGPSPWNYERGNSYTSYWQAQQNRGAIYRGVPLLPKPPAVSHPPPPPPLLPISESPVGPASINRPPTIQSTPPVSRPPVIQPTLANIPLIQSTAPTLAHRLSSMPSMSSTLAQRPPPIQSTPPGPVYRPLSSMLPPRCPSTSSSASSSTSSNASSTHLPTMSEHRSPLPIEFKNSRPILSYGAKPQHHPPPLTSKLPAEQNQRQSYAYSHGYSRTSPQTSQHSHIPALQHSETGPPQQGYSRSKHSKPSSHPQQRLNRNSQDCSPEMRNGHSSVSKADKSKRAYTNKRVNFGLPHQLRVEKSLHLPPPPPPQKRDILTHEHITAPINLSKKAHRPDHTTSHHPSSAVIHAGSPLTPPPTPPITVPALSPSLRTCDWPLRRMEGLAKTLQESLGVRQKQKLVVSSEEDVSPRPSGRTQDDDDLVIVASFVNKVPHKKRKLSDAGLPRIPKLTATEKEKIKTKAAYLSRRKDLYVHKLKKQPVNHDVNTGQTNTGLASDAQQKKSQDISNDPNKRSQDSDSDLPISTKKRILKRQIAKKKLQLALVYKELMGHKLPSLIRQQFLEQASKKTDTKQDKKDKDESSKPDDIQRDAELKNEKEKKEEEEEEEDDCFIVTSSEEAREKEEKEEIDDDCYIVTSSEEVRDKDERRMEEVKKTKKAKENEDVVIVTSNSKAVPKKRKVTSQGPTPSHKKQYLETNKKAAKNKDPKKMGNTKPKKKRRRQKDKAKMSKRNKKRLLLKQKKRKEKLMRQGEKNNEEQGERRMKRTGKTKEMNKRKNKEAEKHNRHEEQTKTTTEVKDKNKMEVEQNNENMKKSNKTKEDKRDNRNEEKEHRTEEKIHEMPENMTEDEMEVFIDNLLVKLGLRLPKPCDRRLNATEDVRKVDDAGPAAQEEKDEAVKCTNEDGCECEECSLPFKISSCFTLTHDTFLSLTNEEEATSEGHKGINTMTNSPSEEEHNIASSNAPSMFCYTCKQLATDITQHLFFGTVSCAFCSISIDDCHSFHAMSNPNSTLLTCNSSPTHQHIMSKWKGDPYSYLISHMSVDVVSKDPTNTSLQDVCVAVARYVKSLQGLSDDDPWRSAIEMCWGSMRNAGVATEDWEMSSTVLKVEKDDGSVPETVITMTTDNRREIKEEITNDSAEIMESEKEEKVMPNLTLISEMVGQNWRINEKDDVFISKQQGQIDNASDKHSQKCMENFAITEENYEVARNKFECTKQEDWEIISGFNLEKETVTNGLNLEKQFLTSGLNVEKETVINGYNSEKQTEISQSHKPADISILRPPQGHQPPKEPGVIETPANRRFLILRYPSQGCPNECPDCYEATCPTQCTYTISCDLVTYVCPACDLVIYIVGDLNEDVVFQGQVGVSGRRPRPRSKVGEKDQAVF